MNDNRIMQQVSAIFGIFMVLFYITAGIYLIFFFESTLNSALIGFFGSVLILYGIFRGYTTVNNIVRLFSRRGNSEEEDA
jgi:hypothetical protein